MRSYISSAPRVQEYQKFGFRRLFARYLDYLLVMLLLMTLTGGDASPSLLLYGYIAYHFVVILAGGKSFGRYVLGIQLQYYGRKSKILTLVEREILLWILFPLVFLSYLFPYSPCLHDRWTNSSVIQG